MAITTADYERARMLLSPHVERLVRNVDPLPRWLPGSDDFWYLRQTADGHEFRLVRLPSGSNEPLFDHSVAAKGIAQLLDRSVEPAALPFTDADMPDAQTLSVNVDDRRLTIDVPTGRVTPVDGTARNDELLSPDGRLAVRVEDGNLILRDCSTGTATKATTDGSDAYGFAIWPDAWQAAFIPRLKTGAQPPFGITWAPHGRWFVAPLVDQRHVLPYPLMQSVPADGSFRPQVFTPRIPLIGEKPPIVEWFVIHSDDGRRVRIDLPYDALLDVQGDMLAVRRWHVRGDRLFAVTFGTDMQAAHLFEIDPESGAARSVISEQGHPRVDLNSTTYNPPNVHVFSDGQEAVWFSQRDGWGHLYLYDVTTGELSRQLTQGDWLVRDIHRVDEAARHIYFTASGREPGNPYYRYLYRVHIDSGELSLLSPEPVDKLLTAPGNDILAIEGGRGFECVSPSSSYVVYTTSPLDGPGETMVRRTADASLVATVEQSDISQLLEAGWVAPSPFVVKAADGVTDVYGVAYRPADFDPTQRYPVVDCEYASPLTAVVPHNLIAAIRGPAPPAPAALAALGFVVIVIDARGTTFRDRDFSMANFGQLNSNGLDDHVAAIRQLAEQWGCLDLDRVGVYGRSYGGFSALRALLEFPDFFKVGSAAAAKGSMFANYVDYHQYVFQGRPQYDDGSDIRPRPDAVPGNWVAADPASQAERLRGKLQILLGELDENVLPGSTLHLVQALIRANKDFDLVYLPDTDHFFRNHMYATRRITDFFVRHLLGEEPPQFSFD